jgi:hypothetical protein
MPGVLLGFLSTGGGWGLFLIILACLDMDFDMVLNKDAANLNIEATILRKYWDPKMIHLEMWI